MFKKCFVGLLLIGTSLSVNAQNVITVSASGGDFANPVDALQAIGTILPAASPANRYLVKVLPGRYRVKEPVPMQPYVDLQGSGIKTTVIFGQIDWQFGGDLRGGQGVINAASKSEIRQLTVRNTQADSSAIGIAISDTQGSLISNVRSVATGNATDSANWKYGIRVLDSKNVRLSHVVARGRANKLTLCQGLAVRNSRVQVKDSRLVAAGPACSISLGLAADGGSEVRVDGSTVRGVGGINGISASSSSDSGVDNLVRLRHSVLVGDLFTRQPTQFGAADLLVSHSQLDGGVDGAPLCFSVHTPTLQPLNSSCLP